MLKILIRIAVNAAAIWVADYFVDGIFLDLDNIFAILVVGAVFGLINAFLKPILTILSLPAILLSFGLFTIIINTVLLWLTAYFTAALEIETFGAALIGSIIVSITSIVLTVVTDSIFGDE